MNKLIKNKMALVKKMKSGGPVVNPEILDSELEKAISVYGLKSKDERKVRDTLVKMRDYFKDDAEGKSISVDPLSKTYTITGPDSNKFTGSADDVKRGWLSGNLKIKDDQDVMSVAASIYNHALNNIKVSSTPSTDQVEKPTLEKRTINDWREFATSKDMFGSDREYDVVMGKAHTDDDRKKIIYDVSKVAVKNYLDEFNREGKSGKYDYSDLENIKELNNILSSDVVNWDKYLTTSRKLGWAVSPLLLNEEEKGALKIKQEEQKNKDFQTFLKNQKLSPEIKDLLQSGNYKEQVSDYNFSSDEGINKWVSDLITQNKALVFKNPENDQQVVVNDKGIFNFEQKNPYLPNYGYSVTHDQYGFKVVNPEENKNTWTDEFAESDTGKELMTNLPGSVYGYSTNQQGETDYQKDILGHRSFTKRLEWIKPDGNRITLNLNDKNQYIDPTGRPIDIKITGFGKNNRPYVNYEKIFSAIPTTERRSISETKSDTGNFLERIKPKGYWDSLAYRTPFLAPTIALGKYLFTSNYETLDQDTKTLEKYFSENPLEINDEIGKIAGRIKWSLLHDKNVINNENKVNELSLLLAEYDKRIKNQVLKNGGIIKAQNGTKIQTSKDYLKSLIDQQEVSSPTELEPQKYRNTSGTWKGQSAEDNALDAVSIAGDVASFVPGIGAIGAATSMGASFIKDVKDGSVDNWGTHALNAGFVGLSLIGLGGLKALVKGAQVAKKSANIAKIGVQGNKLIRSADEIKDLNKFVKLAEKEGLESADDIAAKLSGKISPDDKATYEKGLKLIEKLSNRPGSNILTSSAEKLSNFAGTGIGKKVFAGAKTAMIIPGATSLYSIGKTAANEGIEYTKPSDFRNVAIAGSIGKNWIKDKRIVNAISRQRLPGDVVSEGKTIVKVGNKNIELKKILSKEELEKTFFGLNKSSVKENNKLLDSIKDDIISAAKEEGKTITKDQLKNLKYEDVIIKQSSTSNNLYLGDEFTPTSRGNFIDQRDYELAKKSLDKLGINWKKPIVESVKKSGSDIKNSTKLLPAANSDIIKKRNYIVKLEKMINSDKYSVEVKDNLKKQVDVLRKEINYPKNTIEESRANINRINSVTPTKPSIITPETLQLKPTSVTTKGNNKKSTAKKLKGGTLSLQKGAVIDPRKKKVEENSKEKKSWFNVDSIDISNIAMAANALGANNKSALSQKKAALAGIVTLPTMQKTYFRTASPVSLQAEKQAAETRSYARRLGSSTSDMSRAMDIRLKGNTEANNIVNKGNLIDLEANNKLGESQRLADSQTNQYNLQVIGKNKTNIANAEKQIHLIDANKALAQSQTTNNLVTSLEKNLGRKEFMKLNKDLNKELNSQDFLNLRKSYITMTDPNYINNLRSEYDKEQSKFTTTKSNVPWEKSESYLKYVKERDALKKQWEDASQIIKNKQSQVKEATTNLMYRKAGGTLSKQDRIDLEYEKAKLRSLQKDKELSYKTILKSNELLQKALIKIFK